MRKYRIIGNMTGNSMDAIDLVLTEFCGNNISDICSYSKPFSSDIQSSVKDLRNLVANKTRTEILAMPLFHRVHDEYVRAVADCINEMCDKYDIDKNTIDAIGFHGKTLDHNPPSKAKLENTIPYTLQMGSGQMLANLTGIPVVYDFRSAPLLAGFEAAPLIAPHNKRIAHLEGDGCYYNGGNTSNYTWVINGDAVFCTDSGPCNEYIDNYIRDNTDLAFDIDGRYGAVGELNTRLLESLFNVARGFYETGAPKSGDPQYYDADFVSELIQHTNTNFSDTVKTLEYFAAYIAMYGLCLTPENLILPNRFLLFGGGWKNPIVRGAFSDLLNGVGFVLPEHAKMFQSFRSRLNGVSEIKYSKFGDDMEARMCADMAYHKLINAPWKCPEFERAGAKIVCGVIATPNDSDDYNDKINQAAKQ